MRNYLSLGPVPAYEDCAQVGDADYVERAKAECKQFILLIRATLGEEPEGARLAIKSFQHDFGTYYEVVCYFDDDNETAIDYAFGCDKDAPNTWE